MIYLVVMLNMVLMALSGYEDVKQIVKKGIILKVITMQWLTVLLIIMITVLFKLEVFTTNKKSQCEGINLLNADDDELDGIINPRSEEEPMLYNVIDKTEISNCENTLPIHRKLLRYSKYGGVYIISRC